MPAPLTDPFAELVDNAAEGGSNRIHTRSLDLARLARREAESHAARFAASGLGYAVAVPDERVMVHADPERLRRMLRCMLLHASRTAVPGGSVRVELVRVRGGIDLVVRDRAPESFGSRWAQLREMLPWRRAPRGARTGSRRTALLAARRLAEMQGGSLAVHPCRPGRGTLVRARLPLQDFGPEPLPPRQPFRDADDDASVLERLDGVRVLLVDHETLVAESLQVLFESCGADVRVAGSASQARRVFGRWRPNLVVAELEMPDGDADGLIRSLRALDEKTDVTVPALALTALEAREADRRTHAAGFQKSLLKPADPRELLATARSLCFRPSHT